MGWFFRAVELIDGQWACRRGLEQYDAHLRLDGAIEHLRSLAADAQPAELFVHRLDGTVERLGNA